ncbi:hypothetical protein Unana1_05272 [Umbelopsis nana]
MAFSWFNEPAAYKASEVEKYGDAYVIKSLHATSSPKTDFWRKPPATHRDSGHFYYTTVEGNFKLSCTFRGKWITQYDQAGLMIRLNDQKWIKTGIEYDEGATFASAVATNPYSDWSLAKVELQPNQENVFVEVQRVNGNIFIRFAVVGDDVPSGNEISTVPLRTVNGFTSAEPTEKIEVGIMLCSPLSEDGVQVEFEDISVQKL